MTKTNKQIMVIALVAVMILSIFIGIMPTSKMTYATTEYSPIIWNSQPKDRGYKVGDIISFNVSVVQRYDDYSNVTYKIYINDSNLYEGAELLYQGKNPINGFIKYEKTATAVNKFYYYIDVTDGITSLRSNIAVVDVVKATDVPDPTPSKDIAVKYFLTSKIDVEPIQSYFVAMQDDFPLASIPTRDGYIFEGWKIICSDGSKWSFNGQSTFNIISDFIDYDTVVVYGDWSKKSDVEVEKPVITDPLIIKLMAQVKGPLGALAIQEVGKYTIPNNTTVSDFVANYLDFSLPSNFTQFANFGKILTFESVLSKPMIGDSLEIRLESDGYVYIERDENSDDVIVEKDVKTTVTYMDGGKIYKTISKYNLDVKIFNWYINPTIFSTDTFKGWSTTSDGKNLIGTDWKPEKDITLYAVWEKKETIIDTVKNTTTTIAIIAVGVIGLILFVKIFNGYSNFATSRARAKRANNEYRHEKTVSKTNKELRNFSKNNRRNKKQ